MLQKIRRRCFFVFKRVNRIAIELPNVEYGDANAASAVQELLGGKFG